MVELLSHPQSKDDTDRDALLAEKRAQVQVQQKQLQEKAALQARNDALRHPQRQQASQSSLPQRQQLPN